MADRKLEEHHQSNKKGKNVPVPNQNYYMLLPLNTQVNMANVPKFRELQMRLNELLNMNKKQTEGKKLDSRFVWTVSNFMLMFLEPSILKYTSTPVFEDDEDIPVRSHTPKRSSDPFCCLGKSSRAECMIFTTIGFSMLRKLMAASTISSCLQTNI